MRIEHIAVWAGDLERLREFYVSMLGGQSSLLYENARTGFRSYFISFDGEARLELMSRRTGAPEQECPEDRRLGFAHVALRLGSREAVDSLVAQLELKAVAVLRQPRVTGDGYYEAVVADPEGNRIELVE